MKKMLLSLTLAVSLPIVLCAEDTVTTAQPSVDQVITELRSDCEKIVITSQGSVAIEQAMKELQEQEQALLTRFMTRGFTKDKILVKKLAPCAWTKKIMQLWLTN